jgi:hypothetical protein
MRCDFCSNEQAAGWSLHDYYGWWGHCCCVCFEDISHDSWGKPKHPDRLLMFTIKHSLKLNVDTA